MRSSLLSSLLLHTAGVVALALWLPGVAVRPVPPEVSWLARQPMVAGEREPRPEASEPKVTVQPDPTPPLPTPAEETPLEELMPFPEPDAGPDPAEPQRPPTPKADWRRAEPHRVLTALQPPEDPDPPEEPHPEDPAAPGAAPSPLVPAAPLASTNIAPDYPERARRLGLEGTVWLDVTIAADGTVATARLAKPFCPHGILNRAALTAVRKWRYRPARQHGRAVVATRREQIVFQLKNR